VEGGRGMATGPKGSSVRCSESRRGRSMPEATSVELMPPLDPPPPAPDRSTGRIRGGMPVPLTPPLALAGVAAANREDDMRVREAKPGGAWPLPPPPTPPGTKPPLSPECPDLTLPGVFGTLPPPRIDSGPVAHATSLPAPEPSPVYPTTGSMSPKQKLRTSPKRSWRYLSRSTVTAPLNS
jgi:hypothetical protein